MEIDSLEPHGVAASQALLNEWFPIRKHLHIGRKS